MGTIIKKWFVFDGKQQTGPFSLEEMQDKVGQGKIAPDQFVWCEGMEGWKALGEVDILRGGSMTRRPPTPPPDFALPAIEPTGAIRKSVAKFEQREEHTFVKEIGKMKDEDRTGAIQRDILHNAQREAKAASHLENKARVEIEGTSLMQNKIVWLVLAIAAAAATWFLFLKKGTNP